MESDDELDKSLQLFVNGILDNAVSAIEKNTVEGQEILFFKDELNSCCADGGSFDTAKEKEICTGFSDLNKSGNEHRESLGGDDNLNGTYDMDGADGGDSGNDDNGDDKEDCDNFCVVNIDGSCDDISGDEYLLGTFDMKRNDSMNNLFDCDKSFEMNTNHAHDVPDERYYDTVAGIEPKESVEDLHSTPSSVTLTNINSSTSHQYQASIDDARSDAKSFVPDIVKVSGKEASDLDYGFLTSKDNLSSRSNESASDCIARACDLEDFSNLSKKELVELVQKLSDRIYQQEGDGKKEFGNRGMVTDEDINRLCEIIEEQKHYIYIYHCDREQLKNFVLKRETESAEVIERLQAECLRLKRQNTAAIENRIRNGQTVSRGMMNYLMKAKYDADKMLADCLNKQTKINELRLLILKQQQEMRDLEIENSSLKYYIENLCDTNDDFDRERFVASQKARSATGAYPGCGLSQIYNCDNMDQTPATGHSKSPLISTLDTFSMPGRRRRISSESQRSDKSSFSDVTSPSTYSQTSVSDKETPEEMEAYLQECQLTIEKSMSDF